MSLHFRKTYDKYQQKRVEDHKEENLRANFVAKMIKIFSISLVWHFHEMF